MIVAREVSITSVQEAEWDGFAARCQGSVRGTRAFLAAWAVKHLLRYRLRLFELVLEADGKARKIGQCAVGVSTSGPSLFLDRLHLLPETERWDEAMAAILKKLGAGVFEYGWELNLEPPRDAVLVGIPGVTLNQITPLVVQYVDFSQWPTWDAYYSAISENSRRNAKAAEKNFPDLKVTVRTGARAIVDVPVLVRLRNELSERKGLNFRESGAASAGYVATLLSCARYMLVSVVRGGGRALSCFYAAEFADKTYYLEGASAAGNRGAAWRLLIDMLQRAYERNARGKFIMGYIDYATHSDEKGAGLIRSRRSCRVSDFETSVVRFRYDPNEP